MSRENIQLIDKSDNSEEAKELLRQIDYLYHMTAMFELSLREFGFNRQFFLRPFDKRAKFFLDDARHAMLQLNDGLGLVFELYEKGEKK